jgi:quinol monooxygenase YgiN
MPKVVLKGHIVVPETDLAPVLAELPTHIALTLEEEGCLRFEVKQHPEAGNVFSVYEEFSDRVAFEAHQQRVRASAWEKVAARAKRYYELSEA